MHTLLIFFPVLRLLISCCLLTHRERKYWAGEESSSENRRYHPWPILPDHHTCTQIMFMHSHRVGAGSHVILGEGFLVVMREEGSFEEKGQMTT